MLRKKCLCVLLAKLFDSDQTLEDLVLYNEEKVLDTGEERKWEHHVSFRFSTV